MIYNQFAKRFADLEAEGRTISDPAGEDWHKWSTQVAHLLDQTFGKESPHSTKFVEIQNYYPEESRREAAFGVFTAAKSDFEAGHLTSLATAITSEVLGDLLSLAKATLAEGYKDVAAVLACAALEDVLKRFARSKGLNVENKDMQNVINALRATSLVGGTQGRLLDVMTKIRDSAMHANWDKIKPEDVRSVIGFAEEFIVQRLR